MSLQLILTRHAKSDWDDPALSDHDRPLNPRGQRDAPRVGAWLKAQGHCPDLALISSAVRAQETWARLSPAFGVDVGMITLPTLYLAPAEQMLTALRKSAIGAQSVMMIGHNSGIGDFAQQILGARPDHSRFADYPTCATLVVSFAARAWAEVAWGSGRAVDFIMPRDLPQEM